MKAQHIFEDGIYLLNNAAVARNPLFGNEHNLMRFKEKTDQYLTPLCNIIAYSFHDNQWELLVRMKSRAEFVDYYKKKHERETIPDFLIPESAYIFSQEIANLQSGFVKHYNWLNKRVGALFYRRYQKELIGSELELQTEVERLNALNQRKPHKGIWAIKLVKALRGVPDRSSREDYLNSEKRLIDNIKDRLGMNNDDLEVYFEFLPALKIESPKARYLRQLFKIFTFFDVVF